MIKLLRFLKPYKKQTIIGPVFKLLEAIFELLLPFLMKNLIDKGLAIRDMNYIYKTGAVMLFIAILGLLCALVCQYYASIASQGVGTNMRNTLFSHILSLSKAEIDKFGKSSLTARVTNDINQIQYAVAMLIRLVIRAPFLCIGGFIMAFLINSSLSLIILIIIPIFIIVLYLIMKAGIPLYKSVQQKLDILSKKLNDNLTGVRVIRAFTKVNHEKKRIYKCRKRMESIRH